MDPLIAEVAVAIGKLHVPVVVKSWPRELNLRSGAKPQIIVDPLGDFVVSLRADRGTWFVAQPASERDIPELAAMNVFHRRAHAGHRAALGAGLTDPPTF